MASLFIVHPNLSMTNIDDKSCPNINYYERVFTKNQNKYDNLCLKYPVQAAKLNMVCEKSTDATIEFFDQLVNDKNTAINTQFLNSPEFKLYRQKFSYEYTFVEYHYLLAYTKILKISKDYFSKAELTLEDENTGLELIGKEMTKFHENEKKLAKLIEIRNKFRSICSMKKLLSEEEIYGTEEDTSNAQDHFNMGSAKDNSSGASDSTVGAQSPYNKRQPSISHIEHSDALFRS